MKFTNMTKRATGYVSRIGFYFDDIFGAFKFVEFEGDRMNPWFIGRDLFKTLRYSPKSFAMSISSNTGRYGIDGHKLILRNENLTPHTLNLELLFPITSRGIIIVDKVIMHQIMMRAKKTRIFREWLPYGVYQEHDKFSASYVDFY